jgi:hypothetical protein
VAGGNPRTCDQSVTQHCGIPNSSYHRDQRRRIRARKEGGPLQRLYERLDAASAATIRSAPEASASSGQPVDRASAVARWVAAHFVIAVLCLTVVAAILRFHDYTVAPPPALDGDEMAWTWAGQSLIEDGRPTSWTSLPGYSHVTYQKTTLGVVPIVTPWLDEPPVFALLEGGTALLAGETTRQEANVSAARIPVILLSLISLVLAALLLTRLFGPGIALLGTALLSVSPAITEASRTVESEALLTPLLLGTILLCHHIERGRFGRIAVAALLTVCFIAPLVKPTGLVCAFVAVGLLWSSGRRRLAAAAIGAGALAVVAFALYGALFDWHQFITIIGTNGSRVSGFLNAYSFITSAIPAIAGPNPLNDVIWLIGWLGIGYIVLGQREDAKRYLAWPCLAYVIVMVAAASPSLASAAAWYRIPVMPFVYGAAAFVIWESIARFNAVAYGLVLAIMATAAFRGLGSGANPAAPQGTVVAILIIAVVALIVRGAHTTGANAAIRRWRVAVPLALMALILVANGIQSWSLATVRL